MPVILAALGCMMRFQHVRLPRARPAETSGSAEGQRTTSRGTRAWGCRSFAARWSRRTRPLTPPAPCWPVSLRTSPSASRPTAGLSVAVASSTGYGSLRPSPRWRRTSSATVSNRLQRASPKRSDCCRVPDLGSPSPRRSGCAGRCGSGSISGRGITGRRVRRPESERSAAQT
jgi:hypothetical protein